MFDASYMTTLCRNPGDHDQYIYRNENIRSRKYGIIHLEHDFRFSVYICNVFINFVCQNYIVHHYISYIIHHIYHLIKLIIRRHLQ
jgi:hypothetical protein